MTIVSISAVKLGCKQVMCDPHCCMLIFSCCLILLLPSFSTYFEGCDDFKIKISSKSVVDMIWICILGATRMVCERFYFSLTGNWKFAARAVSSEPLLSL
ncbi:hypothetical protein LguiA_011128 [Lonicera macranthoides]